MSHLKLSAIAVIAILSSGQSSRAGLIQQIDNYGNQGTPLTTPFSVPLSFNQFDTSLGTLTKVAIIVTENATVTSDVFNFNGPTASFSGAYSSSVVSVTGPDGTSVNSTLSTAPNTGPIAAGFQIVQAGMTTGTASGMSTITSDFSSYEETSGFTYMINANGDVTSHGTSSSGLVSFGGIATVYGTVEVDYTYVPAAVPTPSSMLLVGLGLGVTLTARRLRRGTA